jgi:tetratricopeptide (TPR) repeat protein
MPLSSKRSLSPWSRWVVWVPATLLLLAAATAVAADDAKAHYQKATAHFAVGEYHDAALEYEEAFKLKQDPAILFNAAQSFRLAGDSQKALLLYNNIIKLYPGTQYAKDSRERIEKLAQATTAPPPAPAAPPAAAAPPPVTPIAPPAPVVAAPPLAIAPAPAISGTATVLSSPPSPSAGERHPIYTRWWFWTAAGVVVAAGVLTAVALSSGGGAWNNLDPVKAGLVVR